MVISRALNNIRQSFLNEKGFTLTESLVAILILSIIITAFAVLFSNSNSDIFSMGKKSEGLYSAQNIMENAITDRLYTNSSITRITGSISITFSGPGNIPVAGTTVKVNGNYTDSKGATRQVSLTSFVPAY